MLSVNQWQTFLRVSEVVDLETFEQGVSMVQSGSAKNASSIMADISAKKDAIIYGTPYNKVKVAEAVLDAKFGASSLTSFEGDLFQMLPQESDQE